MAPDELRQIGQRLYRQARNYQTRLAGGIGVAPTTVRRWVSDPAAAGHREVPAPIVILLRAAGRAADLLEMRTQPTGKRIADRMAELLIDWNDGSVAEAPRSEMKQRNPRRKP